MDPSPVPSVFCGSCDHPTAFTISPLQVVNLLSSRSVESTFVVPKSVNQGPDTASESSSSLKNANIVPYFVFGAQGGGQKKFQGRNKPSNRTKPLILLGLLHIYMHETPHDDKKVQKFFSCISCISWFPPLPQNTRNRSAEDDASVRATSLTIRLYARDDGR